MIINLFIRMIIDCALIDIDRFLASKIDKVLMILNASRTSHSYLLIKLSLRRLKSV